MRRATHTAAKTKTVQNETKWYSRHIWTGLKR